MACRSFIIQFAVVVECDGNALGLVVERFRCSAHFQYWTVASRKTILEINKYFLRNFIFSGKLQKKCDELPFQEKQMEKLVSL